MGATAIPRGDVFFSAFGSHLLQIASGRLARAVPGAGDPGCKWVGVATGGDGNVYLVPWSSPTVGVVTPDSGMGLGMGSCDFAFIEGAGRQQCKWAGAAAAGPEGNIYCAPFNSDQVLVIIVRTQELMFIPGAGRGKGKWSGAVTAADGKVYCAPFNADSVLVIDPGTNELSFIKGAGPGNGKWFGAAIGYREEITEDAQILKLQDGPIYCAPHNADAVLVIDPDTASISKMPLPPGAGATNSSRWSGASCGADGNFYFAPWNANSILMVQKTEEEPPGLLELPCPVEGMAKYFGAALADGGKVLFAPFSGTGQILVIPTKPEPEAPPRRY